MQAINDRSTFWFKKVLDAFIGQEKTAQATFQVVFSALRRQKESGYNDVVMRNMTKDWQRIEEIDKNR